MLKPALKIFENNLCIGCGVCESLCNSKTLKVKEDNGFYECTMQNDSCKNCNKCVKNCLFSYENFLEYVEPKKAFIGYDLNHEDRLSSASGGVLTRLLKFLLEDKRVNAVVTARFEHNKFVYSLITESAALDDCRGSAYLPLYHNDIWDNIKQFDGTIAFVGTPCFCEEINRLKNNYNKDFGKVKYIFSLVCGHMPSKNATKNYFSNMGINLDFDEVKKIKYRGNGWPGIGFVKFSNNNIVKFKHTDIWNYKNMSSSYSYNSACSACSDLWGAHSQASFGDYWNSDYMSDENGYSLIMINDLRAISLLNEMKEKKLIFLEGITVEEGCRTQSIPVYVKKIINKDRRNYILRNGICKRNRITLFKLEEILKKQKYNSIVFKVINRVAWRMITSGAKKYEKGNDIK